MIAAENSTLKPFVSWFGGRLDQVDLSKWEKVRRSAQDETSTPAPCVSLGQSTLFICAHATGFCKELWLPLIELLRGACTDAKNAHILLIDLAGHGDSDEAPIVEMVKETFADSVEQAIDEFGSSLDFPMEQFSRVVGVGHSMGCTSLMAVSGRRLGLFDELVLYEPVLIEKPQPESAMAKRTVRRRKEFDSREEAFKFWVGRGAFKEWRDDVLDLYVHEALKYDPDLPGFRLKCEPSYEAQVYLKPVFTERLEEIPPSVTILCGSETYHSIPRLRKYYERFPNRKQFEVLKGLDHFGPMHTPGLFLKHILPLSVKERSRL